MPVVHLHIHHLVLPGFHHDVVVQVREQDLGVLEDVEVRRVQVCKVLGLLRLLSTVFAACGMLSIWRCS